MLNCVKMNVVVLLVVGLFVGSVFGDMIETPVASSGSGGGGSSIIDEQEMHQGFNLPGIRVDAWGENREGNARADCFATIYQGEKDFMGNVRYYSLNSIGSDFRVNWKDTSEFEFSCNAEFEILDYLPDTTCVSSGSNSNFNLFGVHLYQSQRAQNNVDWIWEEYPGKEPQGYPFVTDDIEVSFWMEVGPAELTSISLNLNEYSWGYWDDGVIYGRNILSLNFSAYGHFLGENAELIGSNFIPEPATISLLVIGCVGLVRRRLHG